MGYGVHIERANNEPIGLDDLIEAVARTENVQMADAAPISLTNTETGEQISRPQTPGAVEIFDAHSQSWVPAFRLFEGRISTNAARDFDNHDCYQRSVMRALAAQLHAQIVGDEGETYD